MWGFFMCFSFIIGENVMKIYKNVKILYEDNHLLVVVKPAGIPSQADKTGDIDMLTTLKEYIKDKYNKPGNVYLGLVHRLDRMTEGIMVFAKTSKAASRLSKNIREGDFKKKYIAAVCGTMNKSDKNILIENYLTKNEKTNTSIICEKNDKNAKLASLNYTVISNFTYNSKDYSYVEIKLNTGRHHQIRVQMSGIGYPLYGDLKYGEKLNKKGENLALFAYSLVFFHPTKDEVMEFKELPDKVGIWSELNKWK